jgi:hypothetical protein
VKIGVLQWRVAKVRLKARFPATDAWQLAASGADDYVTREGIRVAPAVELLRTLV